MISAAESPANESEAYGRANTFCQDTHPQDYRVTVQPYDTMDNLKLNFRIKREYLRISSGFSMMEGN